MSFEFTGDPYVAQLRAAKAEGELARIKDELRDFAEEHGFNPEMEPRDLLAKAAGAFRSCAAISDARYAEIQELRAEMEAMRPRLIPAGMQWPRDAKGVPIVRGETVWANGNGCGDDRAWHVRRVSPGLCYPVEAVDGKGEKRDLKAHWLTHERPAPKVPDADGVEIRVGDTVWLPDGRGPWSVSRIVNADRLRVICDDEENGHLNVYPQSLTHRAPVLAADGRPIEPLETVYLLGKPEPIAVDVIDYIGRYASGHYVYDGMKVHYMRPEAVTHEPQPDSWERIGADLARIEDAQGTYFQIYGPLKSLICRAQALMDRDGGRL